MKHLKTYKLFESSSEDIQYIDDVTMSLKDDGYFVYTDLFKIGSSGRYGEDANEKEGLKIIITSEQSAGAGMVRTGVKLLPTDIGEYIMTIDSYLKERGWIGLHPYNQNRQEAIVNATLKDIKQVYTKEVSEFSEYLKSNWHYNSPFSSVSIEYYKP